MIRDTMFVNFTPYIRTELNYLKRHAGWDEVWSGVLEESPAGHPPPFAFYPASSGNLIHHSYHAARFQDDTGRSLSEMDVVLEFGGGYGSLCRVASKLGFTGRYIIFDLPHFAELQRYFLEAIGLKLIEPDELESADAGVCCISDLEHLKAILKSMPEESRKLFIAIWSISEAPVHLREKVLPVVNDFDSFLLAYQHRFNEIDNAGYFEKWRNDALAGVAWKDTRIPHIPKSSYLFGSRQATGPKG